ncbi:MULTISPECIES: isopentenyl-diphosphate Delta-isomerase [Pseudomonas]|nr:MULTISPECIES: isopentenyl-diphosphate Delta-isomerase [Pseudomonas]
MEELLILVDPKDRQIGTAGKLRVHQKGFLHRAFSIFIFDQQSRLLLQQRADGKYHSAGLWSNTCCGHPRLGEKTLDAAKRRLMGEMGLTCELSEHFAFIYQKQLMEGMTEHEYDHVLVGRSVTEPTLNPDEAKAYRWVHPLALQDELTRAPETFTVWFHLILGRWGLPEMATLASPLRDANRPSPVAGGAASSALFRLPLCFERESYPLSPFTNQAQQHTRQWLKNMGLEDTPHAARQLDIYDPGRYASYMWSKAPLEILCILSDLVGWFSCQDDFADEDCENPETLEQLIRGAYNSAFTANTLDRRPLAAALADIIRRAARLMPPLWKERVGEQYLNYLLPCATALMHRTHNTQPGIDGFQSLWQNAGGFQVCLEFTYMVQNIQLPSSLYYSQPWQELRSLALNLFKAVNDLLSFRIMENPDDDIYNLLTHLRHTQGYSSAQAAREVSQRIELWANQFATAQARLPERLASAGYDELAQEQLVTCAQALHEQLLGNAAWHLAVERYREIRFKG